MQSWTQELLSSGPHARIRSRLAVYPRPETDTSGRPFKCYKDLSRPKYDYHQVDVWQAAR